MKTIYKYVLQKMPKGARILDIQNQNNEIVMWALVDSDLSDEPRYFEIYGTGEELPLGIIRKYIGTVQVGYLVCHIFERKSN